MSRNHLNPLRASIAAAIAICAALPPAAQAQYQSDFEMPTLIGSAEGTIITGQDGYYVPADVGGVDGKVFTYAGNTLGLVANPNGGQQFGAATRAIENFCRVQRDLSWGEGCWQLSFDINNFKVGGGPSADFLSSVSPQVHPGPGSCILLNTWEDPNTAMFWNLTFTDGVNHVGDINFPPDPEFHHLATNNWYRISAVFNFDLQQLVSLSIRDITGNGPEHAFEVQPADVANYMLAQPGVPTGYRFFAGGGGTVPPGDGNTMGIDNVCISPCNQPCGAAPPCEGDVDGDGDVDLTDLATALANFGSTDATREEGDLDGDGDVDLADLATLLANFGAVC